MTGGAVLSLYNNTSYSVWRILRQANNRAVGGQLYAGNSSLRNQVFGVFDGINRAGGL